MAKRTITVDMTGVETFSKVSEGIHTAKVKEINTTTTQAGYDALQVIFEVIKGEDKGGRVFETFTLIDKALWKFKALLKAIGVKHEGKIKIDLDKLIGKTCDIEVFWNEYNGQTYAKISDYFPIGKTAYDEEEEDEEDEQEEEQEEVKPAKRGRPAKNKKPIKKEEPEEDEEDDDFDDDEEDEEEEEVKPAKRSKAAKEKKVAKSKKAVKEPEPEDEDDDFDDDEDDEWDD
jgi:hypothetical protein